MSGARSMRITKTGCDPGRLPELRADFPRVTLRRTQTDA
jgi:hypothetical protein